MLSISDTSLTDAMAFFARHGLEAGFVVPTATGLRKGIMDAHEDLRSWLMRHGIHDFETQGQGQQHKVLIDCVQFSGDTVRRTSLSLYRPVTKHGDPRLWVWGLNSDDVKPGNLLALIKNGPAEVALINMSDPTVLTTANEPDSALNLTLVQAQLESADPAIELLEKLNDISAMGFVPSLRSGDTGIGYTLETMLGIPANSSREPDYRGIEIKAKRRRVGFKEPLTRFTLFSKTPDWPQSPVRTAANWLRHYGYVIDGRRQLYCTVAPDPNPQGLRLDMRETVLACCGPDPGPVADIAYWPLETLRASLAHKHRSTFWVVADTRKTATGEEFHFRSVQHSSGPLVGNLAPLISSGKVTLDLTLSEKGNGQVRDHGYLFKMWPRDLRLLIPEIQEYTLQQSR